MSKETSYKKEPHPYAEVIKAWADGQDIEWSSNGSDWLTSNVNSGEVLSWSHRIQYKVKPKPPKVIELYAHAEAFHGIGASLTISAYSLIGNFSDEFIDTDNLKLTFCPVTGKLIGAEVVQHEKAGDYE